MNIVIIDVSEYINPVYKRCFINDHDGNLLHNCLATSMYTLFISGTQPQAMHDQLLNDLHGYISAYTTPTYDIVVMVAQACFDIVNKLIRSYVTQGVTHVTVLNTTRTVGGFTMRIGYY